MVQVTNWDKAEVECPAIIKRLAELPCPNCQGTGDVALVEQRQCSSCGGAGSRFTWLRLECPRCHGDGVKPDETGTCGLCDGRGWVPNTSISLEDALASLIHSRGLPSFGWLVHAWLRALEDMELAAFIASEIRLAFWQAVEKAIAS